MHVERSYMRQVKHKTFSLFQKKNRKEYTMSIFVSHMWLALETPSLGRDRHKYEIKKVQYVHVGIL